MSPESSRRASLIAAGLVALLGAAPPVAAHALGESFQLPVPLWLYLAGAGTAVGASFVVIAVFTRGDPRPRYPVRPIGGRTSQVVSVLLQVTGMAWWYGAVAAGSIVGGVTPLPAALFWIGIWVGLPIVAVLLGNPWPSLSPFRTTFGLLERGARLVGRDRLDAGWRYPPRLARWPAVLLLAAFVWAELVLPGSDVASTVTGLLVAYTLLTLVGMTLFGRLAWLRHVELFEVELGWYGRIGPIGRRVTAGELCAGCEEACDPAGCVDCPECAVAAEPGERRVELRPWFAGLTEVRGSGWSDAAFIILALTAVSYDGLSETGVWTAFAQLLFAPARAILGDGYAFTAIDTFGLALLYALFMAVFRAAVTVTRALGDPARPPSPGTTAGAYAATLLPIAAGYVVAHYLTLVIQGIAWIPGLIGDPLMTVAPGLDWVPVGAVWYLSVGAIVVGHVAGIALSHRIVLLDAPRAAVVASLPFVALMIGYTVLSLWIIAQPIVIEPGLPPAALRWGA
ncbi:MAG: hypothetical protein ACRDGV_09795 [Candidatus Limnocylindria bacterium]